MVISRHHELRAYFEVLAYTILLTLSCLLFTAAHEVDYTPWRIT